MSVCAVLASVAVGQARAAAPPAASRDTFETVVAPFLKAHCVKCHGPDKQSGDVRLDDLKPDDPKAGERWAAVRDQLRDGLMPPRKEAKPGAAETRAVVAWATVAVGAKPGRLPNHGNLIPHELLFGPTRDTDAASAARVWRISPEAYLNVTRQLAKDAPGVSQPFTLVDERGIRDFAGLYGADVPTTEVLIRNAVAIVDHQTTPSYTIYVKPPKGSKDPPRTEQRNNASAIPQLVRLVDPKTKPTLKEVEAAVRFQFRLAIGRAPADAEMATYLALYEKTAKASDSPTAAKTVLQAVLLKSDVIFRTETAGKSGRTLLPPAELARAISLTLGSKLDSTLVKEAESGRLTTKQQVETQIRRMLTSDKVDTSRIPLFFREYFEYHNAADVFKDKPRDVIFSPATHVRDTDYLVAHILKEDRDVFRELLLTRKTFLNARLQDAGKPNQKLVPAEKRSGGIDNKTGRFVLGIEGFYGFDKWTDRQPAEMPTDARIGILMQPSWLISWSTNFDNDPVRRGRWIRERLLGGTVPDLPIGVAAQVPDDPHRTYRARLTVTRAAECWKCHQKMDDLGLPFEQFDHYGRLRQNEQVLDLDATAKNVDSKGKSKGPVYREAKLDTSGIIAESGSEALDGPVRDPREMIRKIANSDRARQVFVRHTFRFLLGRNESLADARALQEADAAYLKSGGSFKALVIALVTSDSFLYRTHAKTTENSR